MIGVSWEKTHRNYSFCTVLAGIKNCLTQGLTVLTEGIWWNTTKYVITERPWATLNWNRIGVSWEKTHINYSFCTVLAETKNCLTQDLTELDAMRGFKKYARLSNINFSALSYQPIQSIWQQLSALFWSALRNALMGLRCILYFWNPLNQIWNTPWSRFYLNA